MVNVGASVVGAMWLMEPHGRRSIYQCFPNINGFEGQKSIFEPRRDPTHPDRASTIFCAVAAPIPSTSLSSSTDA